MKNRVYAVATAHLDTVWRWNLPRTINEYLLNTIEENLENFKKFDNYRFNFEGAYRYSLIEEFYPEYFEEIKKLVELGKWIPTGSGWENGDVNVPSPEALFRNFLYGKQYFKNKFNGNSGSNDIFLPDCFGFSYTLPSIAKHCGIHSFSTQKLSWGACKPVPFDIGMWEGIDGSRIFASLKPGSYTTKLNEDLRTRVDVIENIAENGTKYELPWTMHYYGVGDVGGAPTKESIQSIEDSIKANDTNENFEVISAKADQIFDDIENLGEDTVLPVYRGELLMKAHGAGSYTSRARGKRLNAQNEILADKCEKACLTASLLTSFKYPKDTIDKSWKRVIAHQFHDDITGTSNMDVYNNTWNDYSISLSQFKSEYEAAVGAIANELDTSWCKESAIIVNNPVAQNYIGPVEATIHIKHNAKYIKMFDIDGNEIPCQVISKEGKDFKVVFTADIPSVGFKVYDAIASDEPCNLSTDLIVTEHTLENTKYKVQFNKNGDIASIIDKEKSFQILSKPIKMELLKDTGALNYPAWEIVKEDLDREPIAYANTPSFEIVENGPVRIAIKVTRHVQTSDIIQTVSLDSNGETINVSNFINWNDRRSMLKASFPVAYNNDIATYDLGYGFCERRTNSETQYEVPAQKWADISDEFGRGGVSIFSDCKYAWDKPTENTLRLTCIHTPTGAFLPEARQDLLEVGRNLFDFAIYSHNDKVGKATQRECEKYINKPVAFQTNSNRKGLLEDELSLANVSDNIIVRAIKLSEDQKSVVIRVNEIEGKDVEKAQINLAGKINKVEEVLATEEKIKDISPVDNSIVFDIKPFEMKTFKIDIDTISNNSKENYKKLDLEYNAQGLTSNSDKRNVILQGSGASLPSELIPTTLVHKGITFKLNNDPNTKNVLITKGQEINIPKSTTKLYILAASTLGDKEVTFMTDNKPRKLTIHAMSEEIARWDMAALKQSAYYKNVDVALELTHTHHPEGDNPSLKANFYLYEIDVRNCKTLTLPEDSRIVILAMTAVKKFSDTKIATKIIDDINSEYDSSKTALIDKIYDSTGFLTMQAGRVADQIKMGKGKGIKRDNIVTNIVRSFTKPEW